MELKYRAATSDMFSSFKDFVPTYNDDPFNFLDSYANRADARLNAPLYEGCVEKALYDFSTQYEGVLFSSLSVEVKIEVLDKINCLLSSVTVACDAGSGVVVGACVVAVSSFLFIDC